MKKVLFIWDVKKELKDYIEKHTAQSNLNLVFTAKENYQKEAVDAQAIVGWKPSKELLQNAHDLKLYINPGAGVEHLKEFEAELEKCIVVNSHGNAFFTAEHVVAMLLGLLNQIPRHHQWMLEGKWRLGDKIAPSISLKNRVVGLLAYGQVNRTVHKMLQGFGCEFRILRKNPEAGQYGMKNLTQFLKEIDILISTLPATDKTKGLIGIEELEMLGKDGIVVNAGRGKTFDEKALYEALKQGTIHSAAIDVWYNYYPEENEEGKKYPYTYPFYELENILLSPHRAASPFNDLARWDDVIENLLRLDAGRSDFKNRLSLEEGY